MQLPNHVKNASFLETSQLRSYRFKQSYDCH